LSPIDIGGHKEEMQTHNLPGEGGALVVKDEWQGTRT
jgi:hypothetical protein